MKKNRLYVAMLSTFLLCACSENNSEKVKEFYDNSKNTNINVTTDDVLSFDLAFLTKEIVQKVDVLGIIGEGIDKDTFSTTVINNTIDIYRDHKYNGLYCSDWMFELRTNVDDLECKIDMLEIKVDDQVRKIQFDKPLSYTNQPGNDVLNDELQVYVFPNEFPSSIINSGEKVEYSFVANKKMKIENIDMATDMNMEITALLNDDRMTEHVLPLEVDAGTKVNIVIEFKSDKLGRFDYVSSNLLITYDIDGQKTTRKGVVYFSPTSPVDEKLEKIDTLIDYLIAE